MAYGPTKAAMIAARVTLRARETQLANIRANLRAASEAYEDAQKAFDVARDALMADAEARP